MYYGSTKEAGAVALVPGQKWATVKGSGQASYKVGRDGCTCPDYRKRGADAGDPDFMCKHRLALRALCDIARTVKAEARDTGRCTLPAPLARALTVGTAETVARSRRLADILADDQSDLFPAQTLGRDVLGYCDRCGKDLPGGSRCPKSRCGTDLATA